MTHMIDPFTSPYFAALGAPYDESALYRECCAPAVPERMGDSDYVNARGAGVSLALAADNSVRAVFLYNAGVEEFAAFAGAMPGDISLSARRSDVRAALGEPAMAADAGGEGIFAIAHAFDRYEAGPHYIRFEYLGGDTGVRMVTLGLVE